MKAMLSTRMSRKGSVVVSNAPIPPAGVLVNSDRAYSVIAENLPEFTDLHDEAREHAEREKSIGFLQGIKTYQTPQLVNPSLQFHHYGGI